MNNIAQHIANSFIKGGYPIGTVRNGYKKVSEESKGGWVKVSEADSKSTSEPKKETPKEGYQQIYIADKAKASFLKDLKDNGIKFTTNPLTVENTSKSKMAIQMVKERFGAQSIKVTETSSSKIVDEDGNQVGEDYLKSILDSSKSKEDFINKVNYGITNEKSSISESNNSKIGEWYTKNKKEEPKEKAAKELSGTPKEILNKFKIKDEGAFTKEGKRSSVFHTQRAESLENNNKLINILKKIPLFEKKGYKVTVESDTFHNKPERHEIQSEREWTEDKGTNVRIIFEKDSKKMVAHSSQHYVERGEKSEGYLNTGSLNQEIKDML